MKKVIFAGLTVLLCLCVQISALSQTSFTRQQYEQDFDTLWQSVSEDYAYFDQKKTDWNKVREIYRPRIREIKSTGEFVGLLETVMEELYDSHATLGVNTPASPRLVPSGTDVWGEWRKGRAVVTEVRLGSTAEKAGLRVGMQVVSVNGEEIREAIRRRVGKSLRTPDDAAKSWAVRVLLAGRHNEDRNVTVLQNGQRRALSLSNPEAGEGSGKSPLLAHRRIGTGIGYIRINNSLGENDLIKEFDRALAALRETNGLVLDLRDTPSGGNTTVARGIMGRFIRREMPYQKHSIPAEERVYGVKRSWIELVSARGPFAYTAPLVVLVDHWTGSMGEGIAIGLDGMRRATIVGTEMARLIGATSGIKLPNTAISVHFPTEKLFHVNESPREAFVPPAHVDLLVERSPAGEDVILQRGLKVLRALMKSPSKREVGPQPGAALGYTRSERGFQDQRRSASLRTSFVSHPSERHF